MSPLAIIFLAVVLLTIYLFTAAHRRPGRAAMYLLIYAAVQLGVAATGFYKDATSLPPRFLLNLFPSVAAVIWLFFSRNGREFVKGFDVAKMTWIHLVRVPVELVLYGMFLQRLIPRIMTFEGNNFDIVMGLTAPLIFYFGYRKGWVTPGLIKIWHGVGLLLLLNIVVTAVLAAPFPFQQIAFDQPNIGILQAPFNLLPAVVVPLVVVGHLVGLRKNVV